jgi:hypothetical protein
MRTSERDGLNANRIAVIFANAHLGSRYFFAIRRGHAVTIRDQKNMGGCMSNFMPLIGRMPTRDVIARRLTDYSQYG